MAARDGYRAQVELLIRCLPAVASASDFALKGGTAINLFLRDMPRLSVDIDLSYLPLSDRERALDDIYMPASSVRRWTDSTRAISLTSCIFKHRSQSRIPYARRSSLTSPVTGDRSQSFCNRTANRSRICSPTTSLA